MSSPQAILTGFSFSHDLVDLSADENGGRALLLYAADRAAWSHLTRLLTVGKGRAEHGDGSDLARVTNRCFLDYADLLDAF